MGRIDDLARRFSVSGMLDEESRTRERFPVVELEVGSIRDHPANTAYSMDEDSIRALAESIRKDGITDIPLVRKLPDGGYQMLSGHRRKAAYQLLAKDDPAYGLMPCRVIDGITDEEALTLLHTANYFTRELTVMERARATRALGLEAKRMRAADPELKGTRTSELKAAIIKAQTGRDIAPRTIEHHERTARLVESRLEPEWQKEAEAGRLSDSDIRRLSKLGRSEQRDLAESASEYETGRPVSALIKEAANTSREKRKRAGAPEEKPTAQVLRTDPNALLAQAASSIAKARSAIGGGAEFDASILEKIESELAAIREAAS